MLTLGWEQPLVVTGCPEDSPLPKLVYEDDSRQVFRVYGIEVVFDDEKDAWQNW
jgi:hypothetical protein